MAGRLRPLDLAATQAAPSITAANKCAVMLPLPLLLAGAFHHPSGSRVALSPCLLLYCHQHQEPHRHDNARRRSSSGIARRTPGSGGRPPLPWLLRHRGGGGDVGIPPAALYHENQRGAAVMYSSQIPMLEVEEKFDLMASPGAVANVERRLMSAGFVRQYAVEMVDWYFDTPTYALSLNDCWLRYRHEKRGGGGEPTTQGWQLKRGAATLNDSSDPPSSSRATVYEETEGIQAVALAVSLIVDPAPRGRGSPNAASRSPPPQSPAAAAAVEDDPRYPIPAIPPIPQPTSNSSTEGFPLSVPELVPFARIVTHRSHWVHTDRGSPSQQRAEGEALGRFAGLVVDMDATDFGHAVGEVEALVEAKSDDCDNANHEAVAAAQQLIRDFMRQVIYCRDNETDDGGDSEVDAVYGVDNGPGEDEQPRNRAPAQGKLECYLEKFRPELYGALVEAGILRRQTAPPVERRGR